MAYFDKYGVEFSDDRKTLIYCPEDMQGEYIIPEGVKTIGRRAFASCVNLFSIDLGDDVEEIEDEAFKYCKNLRKIRFGINLKKIGKECFIECDKIHVILWDATVCADFEHAWMPFAWGANPSQGNLESWPTHFIESVKYIYFGQTVKHIPSYLCARFSELEELVIPDSVESIGEAAFAYCNPRYIYLNKKTTLYDIKSIFGGHCMSWECRCEDVQLAENPFYYCDRIEEIEVSPQNKTLASRNGSLYDKSFSKLYKIGRKNINYYLKQHKEGYIPSLELNVYANEIEDFAGMGLEVTKLTIYGCASIGKYAFWGCENLQSISFEKEAQGNLNFNNEAEYLNFHSCAFGNCPKLKEIYWNITDGNFIVSESFPINGITCNEYYENGERCYNYSSQITHITLGENVLKVPDFLSLLLNVTELKLPQRFIGKIDELPAHLLKSINIEEQDERHKKRKSPTITDADLSIF